MDCELFQMMPYIIILKVKKFYQSTANRFSTTRQKPVGEGGGTMNRVKIKIGSLIVPNVHCFITLLELLDFNSDLFLDQSCLTSLPLPQFLSKRIALFIT